MAQYIPHPALQGMEMGNRASQQRMNIYAQAVAHAADAINKQAAADAAFENRLLEMQALGGQAVSSDGSVRAASGTPPQNFAPEAWKMLMLRKMSRAGIGWDGKRIPGTVPLTGAGETPFVPNEYWYQMRGRLLTPEDMTNIVRGNAPMQVGTTAIETTNNRPFPTPTNMPNPRPGIIDIYQQFK